MLRNNGEVESECSHEGTSSNSESESSSEDSHYEGDLLMLEEVENQRENIFHSRCIVMGKLRSIIIDGGSSRGELLVNKKAALAFTLGNYEDEVVCDVVPMEATHIFLGFPCQFDRRVTHDGVTNKFPFVHMQQKVVLKPLSTREVSEDQNKIKEERKTSEKTKRNKEDVMSKAKAERKKSKEKEKSSEKSKSERENRAKKSFEEFKDVPHGLSPLRCIEHHIDLTFGPNLPNRGLHVEPTQRSPKR
ncbi:hypothetical protein CR513_35186, partial [Mucuna pruriens]